MDEVLRLVQSGRTERSPPESQDADPAHAAQLHRESVAAITRAAAEARTSTGRILQRLETLLLQVVQLEQQASDLVHPRMLGQEMEAVLKQLQGEIDLRRETAHSVIQTLAQEEDARKDDESPSRQQE